MNSHLIFNIHINETDREIIINLLSNNRIKVKFDNITNIIAIESLTLSILNYFLPVYGTTTNSLIIKLVKKKICGKDMICDSINVLQNHPL